MSAVSSDTFENKSIKLLYRVLISASLGIFVGIFFGPSAAWLRPIGRIYVMLLQSVIYPYLVCSLISNLGRASPSLSRQLFRKGGPIYLILVAVVFFVAIILGMALPSSENKLLQSESLSSLSYDNLLLLLVPENLVVSITNNYVPAVIVFCVLFGLTLQHIKPKDTLLELLDSVSKTCLAFWGSIVKLAPIGVFALMANISGTLRLDQLFDLGEYFLIYTIAVLVLTLWILPGLIATLTNLRYRDIMEEMGAALVFSMATTLSVVSLPLIQRSAEKFIKKRVDSIEDDTKEVINATAVISYPFAQAGGFLLYLYIIFCTLYFNNPLSANESILLPMVNFFSTIGAGNGILDALQFMVGWLELPKSAVDLYAGINAVTRYGQIITSVMGYAFMTFLVAFNYHNLLTFSWRKFLFFFITPIAVISILSMVIHQLIPNPETLMAKRLNSFSLQPSLSHAVHATIVKDSKSIKGNTNDSLYLVQKIGVLRVGFNPNNKPFVYYNSNNELVGFDIEMVYNLAKDLNAKIEFVPFVWDDLLTSMEQGKFDIAVSGLYVNESRLTKVAFSKPYFKSPVSFVARLDKIEQFADAFSINKMQNLRLATFADPVLVPLLKSNFPKAKIVIVPEFNSQINDLFLQDKIDAAVWTQAQTSAWILSYPDYAEIVPKHVAAPFLMAYMVGLHSPEFLTFLNYWMDLQRNNGVYDSLYRHWVEIQPETTKEPRWSIYHNVLGL